MKYLNKYNEGIFSSKKIDKNLISDIDNIKYNLKEGWELDVKILVKENKIELEVYETSKK